MITDSYTMTASIDGLPLVAETLTWSQDKDRVPHLMGTMVISNPGPIALSKLDPRKSTPPIILFSVLRKLNDPARPEQTEQSFPYYSNDAKVWVRRRTVDILTGQVTIDFASGEVLFEDKRRVSTGQLNTNATTVAQLVDFVANDLGVIVSVNATPALTALPAGDRRMWMPGQSATEVFEAELGAINCQFWCDESGRFWVDDRDNPRFPPPGVADVFHDGDDGTIITGTETAARDGDWADGVLVRYQYTNSAGASVTAFHSSGNGANSRAVVINESRPKPVDNAANAYVTRTKMRGLTIEVETVLDPWIWPGLLIDIYAGGNVYTNVSLRAVTFNLPEGRMTLKAQRI